ncbi:MAG TPA: YhjD/YihY/BrkB family envelope integrity protein, partial [Candidatus Sulfotelmatobacter sp.]|nr:YhjD/YihY/BrkB family envelope integrity protein [Candidatus Sulfotelmatobacter sp.]
FLALVYRVAPVRTIRWPAILAAAAIGGALWHVARLAFNYYLAHLARYNLVYGFLGGFVGLLLWIFYTSVILLVGGVLADLFDGGRAEKAGG